MKSVLVLLALASQFAFAAFDLDTVEAIYCTDAAPSADMNISFATDGFNGNFYPRAKGTIPYGYGNQVWRHNAQTGTMKLANDPAAENGVIVLRDEYLASVVVQTLRLIPLNPGKVDGEYKGLLTGHAEVEFNGAWIKIQDRPMNCKVLSPRIPRN